MRGDAHRSSSGSARRVGDSQESGPRCRVGASPPIEPRRAHPEVPFSFAHFRTQVRRTPADAPRPVDFATHEKAARPPVASCESKRTYRRSSRRHSPARGHLQVRHRSRHVGQPTHRFLLDEGLQCAMNERRLLGNARVLLGLFHESRVKIECCTHMHKYASLMHTCQACSRGWSGSPSRMQSMHTDHTSGSESRTTQLRPPAPSGAPRPPRRPWRSCSCARAGRPCQRPVPWRSARPCRSCPRHASWPAPRA